MHGGRVTIERFESAVLKGNRAGDPHVRRVPVYLPPSYDAAPERRYPVLFALSGFTGRGRMFLNDNPWAPSFDDRLDALIGAGRCGEMIVVMPDCFTRYGGSQYLDSTATGPYATHVVSELVPWVDRTFRTLPDRAHRGVAGKSSGGYGALVLGMRHADVFGAVACHSGDMDFDWCYRGDLPKFLSEVRRAGGVGPWLEAFEAKLHKKHEDFTVLNILGMAACYSPNPDVPPFGIDLPVDLEACAFRPDVWERWLDLDPLRLVERHADALRSLRLLHLDCGTRDEWHLHLGLRRFVRRLAALGVAHDHEEFDDGHMNVGYRWDVSLPKLARALGAAPAPGAPR
uniref:Esterase n=1 Tax=Eiseniibacteriota bacterium TaxID=2212470 RepID=A0A832I5Q3_UNCEI